MIDWDKLRIFIPVAKSENISYAASELNLHQSTISRHISALEKQLGMPLFHRTKHGICLSQQGARLYVACLHMSEELSDCVYDINDSFDTPQGRLRIASTMHLGSRWLAKVSRDFINHFPKMGLDFILQSNQINLSTRTVDAAFRLHSTLSSEVIEKKLHTFNLPVFSSKEYINKYGEPKSFEELAKHQLITYGDSFPKPIENINWLTKYTEVSNSPKITINNISGMYFAIKEGLGIGSIPEFILPKNNQLVRILPKLIGPEVSLYLAYPTSLKKSRRIQIFVKHLIKSKNLFTASD